MAFKEAPHARANDPVRLGIALGAIALSGVVAVAVGLTAGTYVPGEGESEAAEFLGGFNGWGALVVAIGTLFLGWAASGRWLLRPVREGIRRHRVGIHTWTSIIALVMALIHSVGLLVRDDLRGWLSGTASLVMFLALFATGWWRQACVRAWGRRTWRWVHWELALAAILIGFEHWALIEAARG